jgi:putative nucleotidyltransferase with HDIG domain
MIVVPKNNFIERIESLPPLPMVVYRVLSLADKGEISPAEIAKVVGEDQAIAAKILRVANSSYYGLSRRVTQLSRAVSMLGTVGLRNIVLGIAARDALSNGALHNKDHLALWRHSIAVAACSELIARHVIYRPPEEAFVAGLLHDIGQLAMMAIYPQGLDEVSHQQGRGVKFLELERNQYGLDHTQAGFRILSRWRLPDAFCAVAQKHHHRTLDNKDSHEKLLAVVMLSDILAQMMGFGLDIPLGNLERANAATKILNLDESAKIRIVGSLNHRVEQALEMFSSIDAAVPRLEPSSSKRVLWISPSDIGEHSIRQILLEHLGYEFLQITADAAIDCRAVDLVVIAYPDEDASSRLGAGLIHRGCRAVVALSDQPEGAVVRRRDEETGLCWIPRFFTAYDIEWAKKNFAK